MNFKEHTERFHNGINHFAYKYFGAHFAEKDGVSGVIFRVWAPHAFSVSVVGDFNNWNAEKNRMTNENDKSIWEIFIPYLSEFTMYKYCIRSKKGEVCMKSDPFAFHSETRPKTASKVYDVEGYLWHDENWMKYRAKQNIFKSPVNIYEIHFGSWKRKDDGNFYSYREMANELIPYVKKMGYTHIELMPLSEHPFDGSWGYQVTGYFSATSRFGVPKDLMYFVDECHRNGVGVIFDWVVAHFPKDAHGLYRFDGEALYEYADLLKSEHPEWGTMIFDYGRCEVKSFLISNAFFWCEYFHIDGIRVDAVASMLYLDYGKTDGNWRPNIYGGNGNLEAAAFLRELNEELLTEFPDIIMIAEESTTWPNITKPPYVGGLGFHFKWNMGWMNDTLAYFSKDPIFRKYEHNKLTFSMCYAFSENFILPFSHDEVVHGKKSLIDKQPGVYEIKFAGLRAMLGYTIAHPGKKLSFMGNEFAHFSEWSCEKGLDWNLLEFDMHRKFRDYARKLNLLYLENPELWEIEDSWNGFEWITVDDAEKNILIFKRKGDCGGELYALFNFSPVAREGYTFTAAVPGKYSVVLNSDSKEFGGFGVFSPEEIKTEGNILSVTLPPMSALFIKKKGRKSYGKI